jgi:putative chitinase
MSTIDFSEADLRRFAPKMADFYRRALLDGKAHLAEAGILDNGKRFSHFMGQVGAETGGGTIVRESLNYTTAKRIGEVWPARAKKESAANLKKLVRNPVALGDWAYGGRMGNRKGTIDAPHPDGYDYRGGGLIQTTGRYAVQKYCDKLKVEIRPDILDDPEATLRFACFEWKESGCNALADANDLMGISRAINTGSANSGIYPNGMEHRTAWFKKAQAIWWDAEPMEASEGAETVAVSVKATVPPRAPVGKTAKGSRTVLGAIGGLFAIIGGFFKDAIAIVIEAAAQIDILSPAVKLADALGITTPRAMFAIGMAAFGLVLYARFDDLFKGWNTK